MQNQIERHFDPVTKTYDFSDKIDYTSPCFSPLSYKHTTQETDEKVLVFFREDKPAIARLLGITDHSSSIRRRITFFLNVPIGLLWTINALFPAIFSPRDAHRWFVVARIFEMTLGSLIGIVDEARGAYWIDIARFHMNHYYSFANKIELHHPITTIHYMRLYTNLEKRIKEKDSTYTFTTEEEETKLKNKFNRYKTAPLRSRITTCLKSFPIELSRVINKIIAAILRPFDRLSWYTVGRSLEKLGASFVYVVNPQKAMYMGDRALFHEQLYLYIQNTRTSE